MRLMVEYDAREERKTMQSHCVVVAKYFQKKFLLESEVLRDLSVLHPEIIMQEKSVKPIERWGKLIPHIHPVEEMSLLVDELRAL